MPSFPHWHRYPGAFIIVFGVLLFLLMVIEQINGRFWLNDFKVYYGAGEAILNGEPLYGVVHGLDTGVFKYAPALGLFYALFALLPYSAAAVVQYTLISIAIIDGSLRIDRLVREKLLNGRTANHWPLFVTALVCVVHFHRELHLGNINMILLWSLIIAVEQLVKGRSFLGGVIIGAVILAKPHFIVLIPLLLFFGRYRAIGASALMIVAGLLAPIAPLGVNGNINAHRDWLLTMAEHNASLIYLGGDDLRSVNTVYSFLHRSILDRVVAPSSLEAYAILGTLVVLFGAFILLLRTRTTSWEQGFVMGYVILLALVPSITLTDTEHFLLSMPLVAYMVHHLIPFRTVKWLPLLAVPVLFAYGGNWEDALGRYSAAMIHYGVLGIGNILLILTCSWLVLRSNHRQGIGSEQ